MADEKVQGRDDKVDFLGAIREIIKPDGSKIVLAVILVLPLIFLINQLFQFQDDFRSKNIDTMNSLMKNLPPDAPGVQPIDVDKANETAFQIKIFFWITFFVFGVPTIYFLSAVIVYAARILTGKNSGK